MATEKFSEIEFFKRRLSITERLLAIKQLQIDSQLNLMHAINNGMPITAVARIYENIVRTQLSVRQVALFIKEVDDSWICITPNELPNGIINYDVEVKFSLFTFPASIGAIGDETLNDFEFLLPVIHDRKAIGYALIGSFGNELSDTKDEKLKFIQTITNIVVFGHESKRMEKKQIDQLVLQTELKMAADMQNMLVPKKLPNNEKLEAAAFYKPHKNIGGDYYDFIELSENEIAFCISDISGKGISAAILMANFQANVHTLLTRNHSLNDFVAALNKTVLEITKGEKFITFFIAVYNHSTRVLTYVNAGHNPSILFNNGEVQLLELGCTILGMFDPLPNITAGEMKVESDSVLLNYTDGLSEAANADGKLFDTEGLVKFIGKNHQLPLEEFNKQLLGNIISFKQGVEFDDDVTLLTLRFK